MARRCAPPISTPRSASLAQLVPGHRREQLRDGPRRRRRARGRRADGPRRRTPLLTKIVVGRPSSSSSGSASRTSLYASSKVTWRPRRAPSASASALTGPTPGAGEARDLLAKGGGRDRQRVLPGVGDAVVAEDEQRLARKPHRPDSCRTFRNRASSVSGLPCGAEGCGSRRGTSRLPGARSSAPRPSRATAPPSCCPCCGRRVRPLRSLPRRARPVPGLRFADAAPRAAPPPTRPLPPAPSRAAASCTSAPRGPSRAGSSARSRSTTSRSTSTRRSRRCTPTRPTCPSRTSPSTSRSASTSSSTSRTTARR